MAPCNTGAGAVPGINSDMGEIMNNLTSLAIAAGIVYAAWKFAPNQAVKAAVAGVAGVMVAKRVPYLNQNV